MFLGNKGIYILFLFLAAALLLLGFKTHQLDSERAYLEKELQLFADSESTHHSIADLRALYFAQLHILDPVSALEGVDIDNFLRVVDVTTQSTAEVASIYGDEIPDGVFFPGDFLKELGSTERMRRSFLEAPTPSSARLYQTSLLKLLNTHREALNELLLFLQKNDNSRIVLWNGSTDSEHVQVVLLQKLHELSLAQQKVILRSRCLTNAVTCESLAQLRSKYIVQPTSLFKKPVLEHRVLENRRIYEAILDAGWKETSSEPFIEIPYSDLPLVRMDDAQCSNDALPRHYHASWHSSYVHDVPHVTTNTLDDLFFFNFAEYTFSSLFYRELEARSGLSYAFQPTSSYLCINYGHDVQSMLSVLYIHSLLKNDPIFTNATITSSHPLVSKLLELEEHIQGTSVISTHDVNLFVKYAMSLYASEGSLYMESIIGKEGTYRILHIAHTWQSRGAWIDSTIGKIDDLMQPELYVYEDFSIRIPKVGFVLTRNMLPVVYQMTNETLFTPYTSLLKQTSEKAPVSKDIYSYERDLKHLWPTPDDVIKYSISVVHAYSDTRLEILDFVYGDSN